MPKGRPKKAVKVSKEAISETLDVKASDQCKATVSEPVIVPNAKLEALKQMMQEINKDRGKGTIKLASEETEPERTSFGCESIDQLTGGGIPHRRFSIIWGPKSAGKTTMCYKLIAEAQSKGKVCAFIDLERTFSPEWATKQGVDLNTLVLCSQYENAEQAMDDLMKITKNKLADVVFIDSVQALSPKGEQETKKGKEKSLEDDTMALLAKKLSQFFRMAANGVYQSNAAIVLVGQARTNLGGFIAFDSLSGGHALAHWSSLTIKVTKGPKDNAPTEKIKEDGENKTVAIGFDAVLTLEKRKVTSMPENTTIHVPFYFEDGFRRES